MNSEGLFVENNGTLHPADNAATALVAHMKKTGKAGLVKVHVPRNSRHHRLLWALLNECVEGGAWDGDADGLLQYLKYATGLVDIALDHNGNPQKIPRSISFASMDQARFNKWFDNAVYVICHRLLGHENWEKLRDQIIESVDRSLANAVTMAA